LATVSYHTEEAESPGPRLLESTSSYAQAVAAGAEEATPSSKFWE